MSRTMFTGSFTTVCSTIRSKGHRLAGVVLCAVLVHSVGAAPPEPNAPAEVVVAGEVRDEKGAPVRQTLENEIVMVVGIEGTMARVESAFESLENGYLPVANLRLATLQQLFAYRAQEDALRDESIRKKEESLREKRAELARQWLAAEKDLVGVPATRRPDLIKPGMRGGYLVVGPNTEVFDIGVEPQGTVLVLGKANTVANPSFRTPPRNLDGSAWKERGAGYIQFLIRISSDFSDVSDFVVFSPDEIKEMRSLAVDASGSVYLGLANIIRYQPQGVQREWMPESLEIKRGVMKLDPALKRMEWAVDLPGLPEVIAGFSVDARGRVLLGMDHGRRYSTPLMLRLWANGGGERPWQADRLKGATRFLLSADDPFWKKGVFAVWLDRAMDYPKLATPIGPMGAPDNAGQPIKWKDGNTTNPINGGHFWLNDVIPGPEGRIYLLGSIPFNMPMPDFEPFIICLDDRGEVEWVNIPITGLLSEPDQKYQAAAVDPSNGDLVVSFWEHGENVHTLIKDPGGFIPAYNGKSGNMKATWIGRFNGRTGQLRHSTYLMSKKIGTLKKARPEWNSMDVTALKVAPDGLVHVCGKGARVMPTTTDAIIRNAAEGGSAYMAIFTADLSKLVYATHLTRKGGKPAHLEILADKTTLVVGTTAGESGLLPLSETPAFLSAKPGQGDDGVFFVALNPERVAKQADWVWGTVPEPAGGEKTESVLDTGGKDPEIPD